MIADLRHLIGPAIPGIVNLVKDDDWGVCQAGAGALSQLCEQGKISSIASLLRVFSDVKQ
jgi:hypothetical protein